MNFNDKFLNVCFKIGKVLFSILLVISLCSTVWLFVNTAIKLDAVNNTKVEFKYNVKNIVQNLYAQDMGINISKSENDLVSDEKISKSKDKAFEIFGKFVDEKGLPKNLKDEIDLPTDETQMVPYVEGFVSFYDDYVNEFSELLKQSQKLKDEQVKIFVENNKTNLYYDAIKAYSNEYQQEMTEVTAQKELKQAEKVSTLMAALISLGLFILFLFLPILIKIEENTRK